MNIINLFKVALRAIASNKFRSFLSMLGIIIGVAAVIIMMAIGQGSKESIRQNISQMGTNIIMIRPGADMRGGGRQDPSAMQTLKVEDYIDDRLEIVSIGGLVPGLSVDDMMLGVSECRNPRLANVFYRLHLIEAYGTGMIKIFNSYTDKAVKPEVSVTGNAFRIILPNVNYRSGSVEAVSSDKPSQDKGKELSSRQRQALDLIRKKGSVTRKDLQDDLGISAATVSVILRELKEAGMIVGEGNTRGMVYKSGKQR